ncbi:MAG: MltA domain-containing protein [Phycisphaerales bacterium]|nr:MltA domain-containing protein [Phycisphaerales bacterium]
MSVRAWIVAGIAVLFVGAGGCAKKPELQPFLPAKDYNRPLAPGQMALEKVGEADYPDFGVGFDAMDREALERSIRNSLNYLAKKSSRAYFPYLDVSHDRAVRTLNSFLQLLRTVRNGSELNAAIRRDYDVYRAVGFDGAGTVYFTGYYCPIFDGRRKPDSRFRYPIYRKPPDLVVDAEGTTLGRRTADGQVVPFFTRREIDERGALRGLEIAWLADPFEAYVVTVQGSAKLRLEDGSLFELGYAGNNGHEYASVARRMVEDGVLRAEDISLQNLIRFFRENPSRVNDYMWTNPRFVFFQPRTGGPFGSLNEPVTPYYSIATDKAVFPRACLAFMTTSLPAIRPDGSVGDYRYAGYTLDQDTGGAIRAAGRADVYLGIGSRAEAVAGRVKSEGQLYYIAIRE